MIEARRKQLLRDVSQLRMANLAFAGGEKAERICNDMENEYLALEGIDRRRKQWEASWNWLKLKKRG